MYYKKHEAKIRELVKDFSESLIAETERLSKTGALDLGSYKEDEFLLAKLLITAAIENKKDVYRPVFEPHKKALKNLLNF